MRMHVRVDANIVSFMQVETKALVLNLPFFISLYSVASYNLDTCTDVKHVHFVLTLHCLMICI